MFIQACGIVSRQLLEIDRGIARLKLEVGAIGTKGNFLVITYTLILVLNGSSISKMRMSIGVLPIWVGLPDIAILYMTPYLMERLFLSMKEVPVSLILVSFGI